MDKIPLTQAIYMAGIDRDDDPWMRDIKFSAWMREVKGKLVDSPDEVSPGEDVEVLIIKGK